MTDLAILESRWQGLERRLHLVGRLRPERSAGVVGTLASGGETRTMSRAARHHRSWRDARRRLGLRDEEG
jgi:hypothetical protein